MSEKFQARRGDPAASQERAWLIQQSSEEVKTSYVNAMLDAYSSEDDTPVEGLTVEEAVDTWLRTLPEYRVYVTRPKKGSKSKRIAKWLEIEAGEEFLREKIYKRTLAEFYFANEYLREEGILRRLGNDEGRAVNRAGTVYVLDSHPDAMGPENGKQVCEHCGSVRRLVEDEEGDE